MWIGGLRHAAGNNTKLPTDKGDEGNRETVDKPAQAVACGSPSTDPQTAGKLITVDTKARGGEIDKSSTGDSGVATPQEVDQTTVVP
jgi:hypothetical protein